jgi:hypothetical protein
MPGTNDEPTQFETLLATGAVGGLPGNPDDAINTLRTELETTNQTQALLHLLDQLQTGNEDVFNNGLKSILFSRCCKIPPALQTFWASTADNAGVDQSTLVDLRVPRPLKACNDKSGGCVA